MSEPQTSPSAERTAPEAGSAFFTAFAPKREERGLTRRHVVLAAVAVVGLALIVFAVTYKDPDKRLVITRHGATHVEPGMTRKDVVRMLGKPTAYRKEGVQDCAQYSNANLQFPRFSIYTLCYEQDRLQKVEERRFALFGVMREDGSLDGPPGHDVEEAKKRIRIF
jgi:hypothetical protein